MAVSNDQPVSAANLKAAVEALAGGGCSEKQSSQAVLITQPI